MSRFAFSSARKISSGRRSALIGNSILPKIFGPVSVAAFALTNSSGTITGATFSSTLTGTVFSSIFSVGIVVFFGFSTSTTTSSFFFLGLSKSILPRTFKSSISSIFTV